MSRTKSDLHKEAFYPHPPERVWAALTDPQALAQWLMPNTFKPILGHEFQFRVDPMPIVPGHTTHCKVLELDPPRRMVWSWTMQPSKNRKPYPTQIIEWTLTPREGGTHLAFTQRGSGTLPFIFRLMMSHGWKTMLNRWLPVVLTAFEPPATPGGPFTYRRMEKAPNKGHHSAKTLPAEFAR